MCQNCSCTHPPQAHKSNPTVTWESSSTGPSHLHSSRDVIKCFQESDHGLVSPEFPRAVHTWAHLYKITGFSKRNGHVPMGFVQLFSHILSYHSQKACAGTPDAAVSRPAHSLRYISTQKSRSTGSAQLWCVNSSEKPPRQPWPTSVRASKCSQAEAQRYGGIQSI